MPPAPQQRSGHRVHYAGRPLGAWAGRGAAGHAGPKRAGGGGQLCRFLHTCVCCYYCTAEGGGVALDDVCAAPGCASGGRGQGARSMTTPTPDCRQAQAPARATTPSPPHNNISSAHAAHTHDTHTPTTTTRRCPSRTEAHTHDNNSAHPRTSGETGARYRVTSLSCSASAAAAAALEAQRCDTCSAGEV